MYELGRMEVKELPEFPSTIVNTVMTYDQLTLSVPSSVLAMTTRFRESLARPVTGLSFRFALAAAPTRSFALSGAGPMSNDLRLIPDCMLYILMTPVEEDTIPKLPHAETQTACYEEMLILDFHIHALESALP